MPNSNLNQTFDPQKVELLLHQYDTIVSLYKHHLDLIFKINIFVYAVTGSILSFYLSRTGTGIIKYSLIFPAGMNLFYSLLFLNSASKIWPFEKDIKAIAKSLGFISYPDVMVLKRTLNISAILYLIIAIGLSFVPILK